jgi:hypothetical protein
METASKPEDGFVCVRPRASAIGTTNAASTRALMEAWPITVHMPSNPRFEEIAMKSPYLAALIGLFACQAAYAADSPAAPKTRPQSTTKNADPSAVAGQATKPIAMSQQDRMRMCSKQATGKKGAERKTFMKSCLTTRKS